MDKHTTRDLPAELSSALCLTTSNNSSLRSYSSSIAESASTSISTKSLGSKVKMALSRKRSQSLTVVTQQQQLTHKEVANLPRNKSISSLLPPMLSTSQTSTRDNSISSLSDFEVELQHSPLFKIEEDSVEKTGRFFNSTSGIQTVKYTSAKEKRESLSPTKVADQEAFDGIANDILHKVTQEAAVEWRI